MVRMMLMMVVIMVMVADDDDAVDGHAGCSMIHDSWLVADDGDVFSPKKWLTVMVWILPWCQVEQ